MDLSVDQIHLKIQSRDSTQPFEAMVSFFGGRPPYPDGRDVVFVSTLFVLTSTYVGGWFVLCVKRSRHDINQLQRRMHACMHGGTRMLKESGIGVTDT